MLHRQLAAPLQRRMPGYDKGKAVIAIATLSASRIVLATKRIG